MKNLTFKAAMLNDSRTTVNRQSTDGQSQRHCKQTPLSKRWKVLMTLVFLFTFAIGNVWGADVIEERTATNDAAGMKNAGTYLKAVTLGDSNASWSSNKLKISSNKTSSFTVEINSTYSSTYTIKSLGFEWDGSGRPSSFSGNSIAVSGNTTWSAGTTTPTKVDFAITAGGSEIKIKKITATLTPKGSSCTAPTNATITANPANAEYTAGDNISLSASATGTTSGTTTYTWYKGAVGDNWATVSATTPIQAASTTGSSFTKENCETSDEGVYWCNISNGDNCNAQASLQVSVTASSGGGGDPEPPAVVCPESGVLFSANAKTTSAKSFDKGTTEITSSDADITGGKVYAISGQDKSKELLTSSGQFTMTNNNTIFKFELDCALAAGDRITIDGQGGTKDSNTKGLWVTSTETRPSSAPACYGENSENAWHTPIVSYVVTSTDAYVGEKTLYVHRQAGTGQNFDNVVVTRPYNISYVSAKGTAQTTPTKGFEVALTQITGVDGFAHTGWTANKAVTVGTTDYAIGDKIPASATAKLSDDTQFTAVWEEVKETPAVTFNDGNYVIGAEALDLSSLFSSENTSAVSFALKVASENASITGTNFTATAAGSYVVVATQVADATYEAVEKEATITVTIPATGTATITYELSGSAATGSVSGVTTISGLSTALTLSTLTLEGTKDGYSGAIKGCTSTTELVEADYVDVQFTVGNGYVFTPSAVTVQVNPFNATGAVKAVVKVMDAQPLEVASEERACAKSTDNAVTFASGAFTNKKFEGTVHLRMYFYGPTNDKAFYIKSPISITGTVAVAPTKYNVNFDKNDEGAGGSQTTLKYEAGAEVTLPACTFDAPTGKEFDAWTSTDVTISDGKFTMPSNAVTIKATWKALTTKYVVTYKDGENTLGTEEVIVGNHPTEYAAKQTKQQATFVGWYNDADLADGHLIADIAAMTVTEDVNVYGKWNYTHAQSANIEQWVLNNGTSYGAVGQLGNLHYSSNITNVLDSLNDDPSKDNRNYAYLGLKVKAGGKMLDFRLGNGQTVKVKFGATGNYPQVKINNIGSYANMSLNNNVWTYTATGEDYISIKTPNDNAVVFKQIMVDEPIAEVTLPWRVTYSAGTGTCATAEAIWSGAALILPDVTAPTDYTFAGWYDGETLAGAAGASYNAEANVTLQAHYAPVVYAINYLPGEHGTGDDVIASAGWGTEYTVIANPFSPETGWVFSGWAVAGVDGVSTLADGGSFTMPKNAVTLTAQWDDVSKVAMIVETSVKYNDLAAAIEAAEPGQTVQLIQDINQEEAILIAKNLTLDLNNKTFTVTNPSDSYSNRAIKVTAGTVIIKDGTVDALSNENHDGGCWGSLRQEGGHLTCNNVTFKNYRSGGLGLKPVGGTLILNECTVLSEIGGGLELGNATVEVNNCTFTQTGTDAQKIYGACFGMGKMGTLTINGGTYTSDNYSFYIYTSGGTINVNSGTFAGDIKTEMNNTQYPSAVGTINISGGTFDGVGENPIVFTAVTANDHIAISGGVFDAPIAKEYCAVNYVPKDNGDGTYGVKPKDGVCLIKGNVGNNTFVIDEEASLLSGTPSKNNVRANNSTHETLTGWKFNSRPAHLGLTLSEGTFQKGDVVEVFVTSVVDNSGSNDKMRVFTENDVTKMLVEGEADMVKGVNRLVLPETTTNALYLVRGSENADYDMWNPFVAYFAVYRPMMPELTAITINDIAAMKGTGNAFSVTLPNGANLASLTVVPTVIRNEAHATTPEAVITNEGAWVFGENTYRVMDKDGDYTDYTITLVEAAGIKEVQISGTLNVMEEGTTTLSALVIDTNDEEAAIQDVTWASDAEGVATVVNGVVTGVAVGTAHITASSVADGSKSKTVEVTVTPFSGCKRAFWFAYADDAAANSVTNNSTVFVSCPAGSSNTGTYKLTIGTDEYTATKNGGSFAEAARLVIPSGFSATFYAKVRGSGSNKKITLISTADESVKYSSGTFSSSGDAQVSIEDIPAGTYKLTSDGLSRLYVMAVEMCKYPMVGVSLTATESVLVGETVTLTPVFDPTNASNKNVTWESDDEDVATVANGVVTGVAAGTANITVTTEDGNFHATCAVTVTELDCDTYMGNLFALTIKDVEASITIATTEIDMATYATIENGTAFTARTSGSASHKPAVKQNNVVQFQYNNDALYLKLNLQRCALKEGDMISITGTDDNEFSFTTDATRATTYKTTGHKYVVQYGDALVGASVIYVWRAQNSNSYLKSISIDRVAPSHTRPVNPAYLGTLCWTNNAAIVGATLYELQGKNENNYLVFDEVISKRLEAGKPYIFMPEDGNTEIKVYNIDDAEPLTTNQAHVNHMYGTIVDTDLYPTTDVNLYYFSSNHIWAVKDFTGVDKITIPAYYCYIDYPAVLAAEPAPTTPAPGRRRVTMGVQGEQVVTGMGEIEASETPMKVMIDGQLFIIRGEKMFDATGRLVK